MEMKNILVNFLILSQILACNPAANTEEKKEVKSILERAEIPYLKGESKKDHARARERERCRFYRGIKLASDLRE